MSRRRPVLETCLPGISRKDGGLTLPEVMIALLVVSSVCISVFAGLSTMSRWALHSAIQSEAHRLLQEEAEQLLGGGYAGFVASPDESITSSVRTTFLPGAQPRFTPPADGSGARVNFTRRVVEIDSTETSRALRVEVEWTWQGRAYSVVCPLFRAR